MKAARRRRILTCMLATTLSLAMAAEVGARGGRGRGRAGGGVSRGGPARGGSILNDRAGGGYRRSGSGRTQSWGTGGGERDGSFENRRGETVDWSGSVSRTDDGIRHEGSWESSSGASGGGSSEIGIQDGRVQSRDRSGHVENAQGETLKREVHSERHDGHVDREAEIRSTTGIDAESQARIEKTDDGFVVRGGVAGKEGAAGGTVVRKGDETWARGAATDGEKVTWGGAHCQGSHCHGGRATARIEDYDDYPYYYHPYYYGWYSCPYGSIQTWTSRYGTPIYGCANVQVVHTTISLGSSGAAGSGTKAKDSASDERLPAEAQVSSAPVLMYELSPEEVAYATTYAPDGVYAEKQGARYFWLPGPAVASAEARQLIVTAGAMPEPTANATVITYQIGDRIVYLTNEPPIPGFYREDDDQLFVWIPGVREPTDADRAAIGTAITAHEAGGREALDREVRKLETSREPPPAADPTSL